MPGPDAIEAEEGYRLLRLCAVRPGTVVLAVSGGRDSMALLALAGLNRRRFAAEGVRFVVASVDHGLRLAAGEEARHVGAIASAFALPHRILRWDGSGTASNLSARARDGRYALLRQVAREEGAYAVLTAHHEDDQIETHLMAAAKGEAAGRLAGMRRSRALEPGIALKRPFLSVARARLEATLIREGIGWREDPTNADPAYARARLRAELRGGFDRRAVLARIALASERRMALDTALARLLSREGAVRTDDMGHCVVSRAVFASAPPAVAAELLARALTAAGGSPYPPERAKVERLVNRLRIESPVCATLGGCRLDAGDEHIVLHREFGRLGPPDLVLSRAGECVFDRRFELAAATVGARLTALGRLGRGNPLETTLPVLVDAEGRVLAAHGAILRKLPPGTAALSLRERVGWRLLADLPLDEGALTGCGQIAANPPEPVGKLRRDHYFPLRG